MPLSEGTYSGATEGDPPPFFFQFRIDLTQRAAPHDRGMITGEMFTGGAPDPNKVRYLLASREVLPSAGAGLVGRLQMFRRRTPAPAAAIVPVADGKLTLTSTAGEALGAELVLSTVLSR